MGAVIHKVRLLFDADVGESVLDRQWHAEQRLREVYRWVLAWGSHVQVLVAPADLKEMAGDEFRAMYRRL